MAIPTTKATFKNYCLRALGYGVIDINISDDQADDRIDEAIQYFAHYHYDGVERMYLKYLITEDDVTRARSNLTNDTVTDTGDGSTTASWLEGKNYIPVPSAVMAVTNVFPFEETQTNNMFDIRYQLRLNDLYYLSSTSILHYDMTMKHLDYLQHILVGEVPFRYLEHQNRLYLDMDWENDVTGGSDYIVVECHRKLDPSTYTDIYDDIWLKRYAVCLLKRQWGANLSKFNGVAMLGGVTMNGTEIYSQAITECNELEEKIAGLQLPPMHMVG